MWSNFEGAYRKFNWERVYFVCGLTLRGHTESLIGKEYTLCVV